MVMVVPSGYSTTSSDMLSQASRRDVMCGRTQFVKTSPCRKSVRFYCRSGSAKKEYLKCWLSKSVTYSSVPLALEHGHLYNIRWRHVVVAGYVVAPVLARGIGDGAKEAELSRVVAVEVGAGVEQGNAGVGEGLAQNAVAGPVARGEGVVELEVLAAVFNDHLERGARQDEAGAAVGEGDVADDHGVAEVVRLGRVEVGDPVQYVAPEDVAVALVEDVPVGARAGSLAQRLLGNGQELPLVQPPARGVTASNSTLGGGPLRVFLVREGGPAALLHTLVVFKVWVGLLEVVADLVEGVLDVHAVYDLVVVGVDGVVWDAAQAGGEVGRHLV